MRLPKPTKGVPIHEWTRSGGSFKQIGNPTLEYDSQDENHIYYIAISIPSPSSGTSWPTGFVAGTKCRTLDFMKSGGLSDAAEFDESYKIEAEINDTWVTVGRYNYSSSPYDGDFNADIRTYVFYTTEIEKFESELVTLNAVYDAVTDKNSALLTHLDSINNTTGNLDYKLGGIQSDTGDIKTYTDGIEGKIDTVNTRLNTVNTTLGTTNTKLTTIDGHIDGVEGKLDTLHADVDGVETTIGLIKTNTDDGNTKLDIVNSKLTTLHTDVDGVEGKLDTSNTIASDIKSNTDDLKTYTDTVEAKLTTLHNDVDQVENKLDTANANLTEIIGETVDIRHIPEDACIIRVYIGDRTEKREAASRSVTKLLSDGYRPYMVMGISEDLARVMFVKYPAPNTSETPQP